jgi:membrane-associated protein
MILTDVVVDCQHLTLGVDVILHINQYLNCFVREYGTLTYAILFTIVLVETGFIVMPLLPGDSLLFAAGAIAASGQILDIKVIIPLLIAAALTGDNINYVVGKFFSQWIRKKKRILFFKHEYLDETENYYARYGGVTVIMARFIPIVRTVAPFVAGAGAMPYWRYLLFCISGAILWVTSLTLLGFFFGNLEIVQKNFELVIFAIIGLSVLPVIISAWRKSRS